MAKATDVTRFRYVCRKAMSRPEALKCLSSALKDASLRSVILEYAVLSSFRVDLVP